MIAVRTHGTVCSDQASILATDSNCETSTPRVEHSSSLQFHQKVCWHFPACSTEGFRRSVKRPHRKAFACVATWLDVLVTVVAFGPSCLRRVSKASTVLGKGPLEAAGGRTVVTVLMSCERSRGRMSAGAGREGRS